MLVNPPVRTYLSLVMIDSRCQFISGTQVRILSRLLFASDPHCSPASSSVVLDAWKFNLAPGNGAKIYPAITISSVAAADFNHDGRLDLLVQGVAPQDNSTTVLQIWLGDLKNLSVLFLSPVIFS